MTLISALLTIAVVYFSLSLRFALRRFRVKERMTPFVSIDDAPTISVCIPARNEDHAMTQCLESVLSSNYPKMEVIVLDDGSRDNTSMLIKSFAHSGVRFIEGVPLPSGWLGKNHAQQTLLHEASGSIVLFMDVDTRIKPDTISQLIAYSKNENADMVSVVPQRSDGMRASVLFSPLRYFWSIILHSQKRPVVASALWMIRKKVFLASNGFENVKMAVQPESRFASTLWESYRALIGSAQLGVSYEKKWRSQLETSARLLYPLSGGQWISAFVSILFLLLLNIPALILLTASDYNWAFFTALWHLVLFIVIYGMYTAKVWRSGWWIGALLWPVIIAQELLLYLYSSIQYLRGVVTWKGRRIYTEPVDVP